MGRGDTELKLSVKAKMPLRLTGKGSILDAIGGALNTGANAVVSGVKDVGDLGSLGLANLTNNQQAAQNARNAISTNNQNIAGGSLGQNLGGLGLDAGRTALAATQFIPQFAENYSNTFANLGNQLGGGQNQTIQQNMGGTPLLNKTLKISGATGKNKQLASDVAQIGLAAATPAISKAIEPAVTGVVGLAAPRTAVKLATGLSSGLGDATIPTASKIIPRGTGALTAGGVNAGFSGSSYLGNADKPTIKGLAGATGQGLAGGLALGTGGELLGEGLSRAKPLNEAGAVGKDVNTPKFNDPEIAKASQNLEQTITNKPAGSVHLPKGPNLNEGAFGPEDQAKLEEQLVAGADQPNLSDLSPKEQMALFESKTPLNDPEVNTARNPIKGNIPTVAPGDYEQVISNEQAASKPVQFAGERWQAAMQKLRKTSPDDYASFWERVEDPTTAVKRGSPELTDAINKWRQVDDSIHANSQVLGGNTNYLNDHALHPWNLPEGYGEHVVNGGDPTKFSGLNSVSRKYRTIAEGKAAGLKLGDNPIKEGQSYIGASAALLKRRAIVKGLGEADGHIAEKTHAFDIGGGQSIPLSKEGRNAVRGLVKSAPSDKALIKGARTVNTGLKSAILSGGQFHPINIAALRAAPTLALPKPSLLAKGDLTMGSHPIAATKGLYKTFRVLFPGGKGLVEKTLTKAQTDTVRDPGTGRPISYVEAGAKIGAPYGAGGFDTEGSFLKGGLGHETVFGKQMPMMHDQVVRSVVNDLVKSGVPLDSAEARAAGETGNNLMGFVNSEAQHVPPQVSRWLGDSLLAKQFTHSKFSQLRNATGGSVGGAYARANVAANVVATTAVITGLGYLAGQKSDNIKDLLLRALVDPGAPTPSKDNKGNTIRIATPGTDTSDVAKLLGMKLVRNADGHLGISWKITNAPSTVEDYLRARLSPFLSTGVKIKTNSTYANKPLYDPNAQAGVKAEQGATSVIEGLLPIGLQGLPMTNVVEKHLPGNVQDVINAQKPGTNPLLKSVASSFGFTPKTDSTVGKGQQTSQFYDAATDSKEGLNSKAANAVDRWIGSKKNPVTGKYDVPPNVNDTRDKAVQLLDNSTALDAMIKMNQKLSSEGQKTDPLWSQPVDKIVSYLQYQAMPPGGPDQANWRNHNTWYNQDDNNLYQQRQDFFNSLPPGDPNKSAAPIEYPTPSLDVAQAQTQYFNLYKSDPTQAETFLLQHPEVQDQMDKQAAYTNQLRQAEGYAELRTYPKPNAHVQAILDAMPQGSDAASRKARALAYQDPEVAAWSQEDAIYNLTKGAGLAQLQGNSLTSKDLKATQSLQYDIAKNPDGSLSLKYTDPQGGMGATPIQPGAVSINGPGSSAYKKYSSYSKATSQLRGVKMSSRLIKADMQRNRIRLSGRSKPLRGFGLKGQPHQPKYVTLKTPKTGKLRVKSSTMA